MAGNITLMSDILWAQGLRKAKSPRQLVRRPSNKASIALCKLWHRLERKEIYNADHQHG